MGKTKKSFIDRKNASVYRLVHPTVHGDTEPSVSDEGLKITPVFQKVRGAVDYFSEEEEEEPYREDSGDEEEFGNTQHEIECEASGEEEGDEDDEEDEFDEIGQGEGGATASETALKRNVWLRSKEETMSEYSSWSSRSASSYLPPARRKQVKFGLIGKNDILIKLVRASPSFGEISMNSACRMMDMTILNIFEMLVRA